MVVLVVSSCTWLYGLLVVVHGCTVVASSCTWLYWLSAVVHGCTGCLQLY